MIIDLNSQNHLKFHENWCLLNPSSFVTVMKVNQVVLKLFSLGVVELWHVRFTKVPLGYLLSKESVVFWTTPSLKFFALIDRE